MTNEINSIGFALDPMGSPAFLLDWELTKKCNLDCSYCPVGIDGGHDNSIPHPQLKECLQTIDFMYEYVDLYMLQKKETQRKVILNVYGGESLFHPDIVEILMACKEKHQIYKDRWELTIITTTNAVVNKSIWQKLIPLIDEFTVSYHAENLSKQERLFFDNLLMLQKFNKRVKVVVMMHNNPMLWKKSVAAIDFCKTHNFKFVSKPFDQNEKSLAYTGKQFDQLKTYWLVETNSKNIKSSTELLEKIDTTNDVISICNGRACCGGRKLSLNNNLSSAVTYVPKQGFQGWHCSVNWFFLYVRQVDGNIFTNRDCRTSLNSQVEPIGNLKEKYKIIDTLKSHIENKTMPVIKCVKELCMCGYCAPKAENIEDFKNLIKRNVITDIIKFSK
jgi:hypothetical protein